MVRNQGDMYKASALSLRERVAEGRVRVYRTILFGLPSPALRAPSPGGRGRLPLQIRHRYKDTFFPIHLHGHRPRLQQRVPQ